ncbi:MAG: protein-disulfide reductase DsbD family protein [Pirellulaceae bacterium]
MSRRFEWMVVAALLAAGLGASTCGQSTFGQVPPLHGNAPGLDDPLNVLSQLEGPSSGNASPVEFAGSFRIERDTRQGHLAIEARIEPGFHIYSTTQPAGGPRPTMIDVVAGPDFQVTGEFVPDRDPAIHEDPAFPGIPAEEFATEVTWSAPITLSEGTQPEGLTIQAVLNGQVCEADGSCQLISDQPVMASFAGYYDPPRTSKEFQSEEGHLTLVGHVEPKVAAPGGTLHLVITGKLAPNWHVYRYAESDPEKVSKPTLIVLRKTSGWRVGKPTAVPDAKPQESGLKEEPIVYYHEGTVTWTVPLQVPKDARPGTYDIAGAIGFQTCTPTACDFPAGAEFRVPVAVAPQPARGTIPLTFSAIGYDEVAKAAAASAATSESPANSTTAKRGTWSDKSLLTVLTLAFLAGLILNVMPCVLPVIGLKIMSFVQQAGGSRGEILALNLWFSLGLMTVFWILAGAAAFANQSWGQHFGNVAFIVTMIGVVFAFGLSFLGVWEIPIPGFVGSGVVQGAAEHEGAIGAFSKGVLSTILATPCAGPLLVPAVSWALAQPSWLTFLTFTSIGVGMATPYLLIGAFPRLISFLPKPGLWMDTFKQLMGFLMLGTAVFLFSSLEQKWVIPTLTLLLGVGIGCWWLGRTPLTAEFSTRMTAWISSLAVIALAAVIGFLVLVPRHQLDWIPFTRAVLEEHRNEGRTVLVDFTAHW